MIDTASLLLRRAVALVPLVFAACAFAGPDAGPTNTCVRTSDCHSDAVCDASRHICVAVGATAQVLFYATPPPQISEDRAAPTQLDPQTVATSGTFDIAMRPAVLVSGQIVAYPWPVPAAPMPTTDAATLTARVEFRRQGAGNVVSPISVQATATTDGPTRTYTWSQSLPEGVYDMRIVPNTAPGATAGADVPPYNLTSELVLPGDGNHTSIVQYPSPHVFQGVLHDALGAPIAGVRVQAVDASDGSAHSTTATSGSDGSFAIVLSPELMPATANSGSLFQPATGVDWVLEVTPIAPTSATPGQVAYRISPNSIPGGGYGTDTATLVLPTRDPLVLDAAGRCTGCETVSGTVEGTLSNGGQPNVTSGTVDFTSSTLDGIAAPTDGGVTAVFRAHATLDAMGNYTAQLLPGRYDVMITPNLPTQLAITHIGPTSFVVGAHADHMQLGRALTVDPQVPVRGSIQQSASGNADLSGYTVTAVPSAVIADPSTLTAADLLARAPSPQLTLADGSYLFYLDPGPYRIVVTPPATTAFAPFITGRDVLVRANYQVGELSQPLQQTIDPITFNAPVQVSGHVLDASQSPIAGASILSFARLRSALVLGRATATLDVPLGTTTSGSDGSYAMLLSGQGP